MEYISDEELSLTFDLLLKSWHKNRNGKVIQCELKLILGHPGAWSDISSQMFQFTANFHCSDYIIKAYLERFINTSHTPAMRITGHFGVRDSVREIILEYEYQELNSLCWKYVWRFSLGWIYAVVFTAEYYCTILYCTVRNPANCNQMIIINPNNKTFPSK